MSGDKGSGEESNVKGADKPSNKVARLIDTYDFGPEFGDELESLWTAEGEERESLRSLADRFNKRVLEAEIDKAGMTTLNGEVPNLYRLLTSDDVSRGVRTEARKRLEQGGVNVERLERSFITYQAIRSYLKEYRGTNYQPRSGTTRIDGTIETIQRLQSRARLVVEKSITQLRDTGRLSIGDFRLFIDINVLCEDCDTQYGVIELLKQGGCKCDRSD